MTAAAMTPQQLAEASAAAMWAADAASQRLGMEILAVGPGTATLAMTVRPEMANGHGTCHGGYIFLLADSAFAFACNSHNLVTVAQHAAINFLEPVRIGDRLVAEAREVNRRGRSGLYDVRVTNRDGLPVAEFRGLSRSVKGTHVPL